jgi:pyruvate-formate lyase
MLHNTLDYWRHLQNLPTGHVDLPSPRVCRLMQDVFERWRAPQVFPAWNALGHLRDHLDETERDLMKRSVAVRRGTALKKTLAWLVSEQAEMQGLCLVNADELIVGTMPPFSVGQGKEIMEYLTDERDRIDDENRRDERLRFEIRFLNGFSNFGHIVPDHEKVMKKGLRKIIAEAQVAANNSQDEAKRDFYESVRQALEGCLEFAKGYSALARRRAKEHAEILQRNPEHPAQDVLRQRIAGMNDAADRLERIPAEPCASFVDAVQCLYLMNCALHWTGELTSLGRLDQILHPYYKKSKLPKHEAQEIIDCLWVKLDERVTLDKRHLEDRFSSADGALLGGGGASNFDQGALSNQWMQQVTIGGVLPTNDREAVDATNDLTRMCLAAARRLPFNCPTLDLRVHKKTPADLLSLAADALLSGGAHPILMNDDKLISQLHRKSGGKVDLKSARNYACDGCYETLFAGETAFSFFYVPGLDLLEKALNGGAGFRFSGGTYLRGMKGSFRTPPAREIRDFAHFYEILEDHLRLSVHRGLGGVLAAIGSKGEVCPSPLLSAMITGCLETGRDFYAGGPRYHMFAPLMTGISTVADSMYVIRELVFAQKAFTLEDLVACLRSNWGERTDVVGKRLTKERATEIRHTCLAQPKFGTGKRAVDELAWKLIQSFIDAVDVARSHPFHREAFASLRRRYDDPDQPFNLLLTPGVGTFEQYVFGGSFAGATADGRMAGQSVASDLSAAPLPEDLDPISAADCKPDAVVYAHQATLLRSLASWNHKAVSLLSDGAPSDFNIREDFPKNKLVEVLKAFADGKGSNMMTVTTANPETLRDAEKSPTNFDLLRVRMGGWTEFYSVLFEEHKKHHRRRRVYLPS